jgi:lysozyme family protein
MAEVYTISGPFGASVSAPRSAPLRLQNALKALGNLRGDPTLSKIGVDGIIGPKTVKAVNYAIAQKYVVMKDFPRPELTLQHVRQFSAGIAAAVEGAVKAGGGTFPLVAAASAAPRSSGRASAIPLDIPAPAPEADRKWVWWAVGGLGVLVVLSIAAKALRGGKSSRRRSRDDDED